MPVGCGLATPERTLRRQAHDLPSLQGRERRDVEACFTCGKALFALTQGISLAGRYEILSPLGRGGMGMAASRADPVNALFSPSARVSSSSLSLSMGRVRDLLTLSGKLEGRPAEARPQARDQRQHATPTHEPSFQAVLVREVDEKNADEDREQPLAGNSRD